MQVRFPETLRRNGVAVSGYRELTKPLMQLDELDRLWTEYRPHDTETSHVLVLTAQRWKNEGQAVYVEYGAVLWDTSARTLAWKGAPRSARNVGFRGAPVQAEVLAGDVLRALHRDAVIALPKGYPLDADASEIPREWVPIRLY